MFSDQILLKTYFAYFSYCLHIFVYYIFKHILVNVSMYQVYNFTFSSTSVTINVMYVNKVQITSNIKDIMLFTKEDETNILKHI